ncbi:hypothetical protein FF38_04400 [Lucilia cuprina]|uniref:Chitin-binding type-4 domain-containing protein n=1 Tax=Lucilia cuprina TaxID=7375 RepID=A0A0L0C9M8_LUCCU|nr:hypothetical protein CVS40_1522 [Lucilia cuprina]KNC28154.1 hypothetical protein FF38_04400 [Lucilia cuprina]
MKSFNLVIGIIIIQCLALFDVSWGHGMMLSPPGRSSRWRYDHTAPVNYDDNANFCGGFGVQWHTNDGKCGLCGDNYSDPTPRANELGGKYGGSGVIVQTYENTYTANVGVQITANHLGYIYFELCNLDEFHTESEECFRKYRLKFADGSDKFFIGTTLGWIESTIVLPTGLSCEHCVLRWTYRAGNNWGICENGTGAMGCGPQEHFLSCADIRIKAPNTRSKVITLRKEQIESEEVAEIPIVLEK